MENLKSKCLRWGNISDSDQCNRDKIPSIALCTKRFSRKFEDFILSDLEYENDDSGLLIRFPGEAGSPLISQQFMMIDADYCYDAVCLPVDNFTSKGLVSTVDISLPRTSQAFGSSPTTPQVPNRIFVETRPPFPRELPPAMRPSFAVREIAKRRRISPPITYPVLPSCHPFMSKLQRMALSGCDHSHLTFPTTDGGTVVDTADGPMYTWCEVDMMGSLTEKSVSIFSPRPKHCPAIKI